MAMIRVAAKRVARLQAFDPPVSRQAALFHERILRRYRSSPRLSLPPLVHRAAAAGAALPPHRIGFSISHHIHPTHVRAQLPAESRPPSASFSVLKASALTLETLFGADQALHHLVSALWKVYHSNNLQLSQSFLSLIHAAAERRIHWRQWISTSRLLTGPVRSQVVTLQKLHRRLLVETRDRAYPVPGGVPEGAARHEIVSRTHSEVGLLEKLTLLERVTQRSGEIVTLRETLLSQAALVPLLRQLYEGMESNALFYTTSAYQSTRTLFRLTNSLWKVYHNQNLALSRSFTRLIHTVTEQNPKTRFMRTSLFSSTQSLKDLVGALRSIFSGNNLQLRHSLVTLMRDIHTAGGVRESRPQNNIWNLYPLRAPGTRPGEAVMRHGGRPPSAAAPDSADFLRTLERVLEEKLKAVSAAPRGAEKDAEALYQSFAGRFKREQQQEWRYEKLQRGLF